MAGTTLATGTGVSVIGTTRIQDALLEARAQQARGATGAATEVARSYAGVEAAFGEPGDDGIQAQLATYWNSWAELSNNPTSSSARTLVLEEGAQLASSFSEVAGRLSALWSNT